MVTIFNTSDALVLCSIEYWDFTDVTTLKSIVDVGGAVSVVLFSV
jgi:hypothetical protein